VIKAQRSMWSTINWICRCIREQMAHRSRVILTWQHSSGSTKNSSDRLRWAD